MDDDVMYADAALDEDEMQESEEQQIEAFLAKRRAEFERDRDADQENRREGYDDIKFVTDPVTQWDSRDREAREKAGRPCPSLNRLQPFMKQITNNIRRNKPEIEIKPVEENDQNKALIFAGIKDHIERQSNASRQYAFWAEDGIKCGIGHLRGAFQPDEYEPSQLEIVLEHIEDPLSVLWDASSVKRDRSDARRCWVIDYIPDDEIDEAYAEAVGEWPDEEESTAWTDWHDSEHEETRVCEYYCLKDEEVIEFFVPGMEQKGKASSEDELPEGAIVTAKTKEKVCRVWLLTGGKILEGGLEGIVVPGGRIPIFPYIPSESRVGRRKIRKGLVRDAKDSVRMINWAMALMIEAMAATPKPKWTGPAKAFEGYEDDWENASTSNKSYLPFNDNATAAPTYNQPPPFNVGLVNAMQVFDENIKQVTGIYDASLGARSNETSGKAIRAREEQGDTATFDYLDEFNYSIAAVGRWLVRVIPIVYNQERQIKIIGEDGKEKSVRINGYDPATDQPVNLVQAGRFDVIAKAGPGFASQRERASEVMQAAIQSAPQLAPILLDLLMELEDFKGADRAAKRLNEMLPPAIKAMESGQPPPQPQPNPKDVAEAQRDMAEVKKTEAETQHQRMETLIMQLQAIMSGLPPQLFAAMPSGGMGNSAPSMGGMPPGMP